MRDTPNDILSRSQPTKISQIPMSEIAAVKSNAAFLDENSGNSNSSINLTVAQPQSIFE